MTTINKDELLAKLAVLTEKFGTYRLPKDLIEGLDESMQFLMTHIDGVEADMLAMNKKLEKAQGFEDLWRNFVSIQHGDGTKLAEAAEENVKLKAKLKKKQELIDKSIVVMTLGALAVTETLDDADRLSKASKLVQAQAKDPGLWFHAETAPESYLQKALRACHEVVEGKCEHGKGATAYCEPCGRIHSHES